MNYRQLQMLKDKRDECRARILKLCPTCPTTSGIYFLLREEDGFRYAYIGQSVNILQRLADHLQGYQYIDLSIKKHGLWSEENQTGWNVHFLVFPKDQLDEQEQYYIKKYANAGYQLRNVTSGSQGKGKKGFDNAKSPRNYYDGLSQGYRNAQKFVANLFDKHLDYKPKSDKPNKNQEKAMQKFKDFLEANNDAD